MPGIGIIVNPNSKQYKNNPEKLRRLGFIVGERGNFAHTQDLKDIHAVAQRFKEQDVDILALSGGDGTNHRTLTTFIKVYGDKPLPKIALLKGGTINTVAYSCGVRGNPDSNLSNLLFKYHEDDQFETTEVVTLKINDHYGFIWGCGVIYRFMEAYYTHKNPSLTWAGWTLARSIGSALANGPFSQWLFERMEAKVTVDGKPWPFKNYSAIYAGSVQYLGFKVRAFHHAQGPEHFHAACFSVPARTILRYIPRLALGKATGCDGILEMPANEMTVELAEPEGYTIDGDMHAPVDRFVIAKGPRLTVIVR